MLNIQDACFDVGASASTTAVNDDHEYIAPTLPRDSRAPSPGLNTLANHGYIPRSGRQIEFIPLVCAIMQVYNISLPLALLLSVPGFLIYAQWEMCWVSEFESSLRIPSLPSISYTLTLSSLSSFGPGLKIAHRASLVHLNYPSQCPDIGMVEEVLKLKSKTETESGRVAGEGLSLEDLAKLRVLRERESESDLASKKCRLDKVHEQVALGESALTWLLFAQKASISESSSSLSSSSSPPSIPLSYFTQWFGEERIPDGWTRPASKIGLLDARKMAGVVQQEINRQR
ncbi:hypothetical protein F5876DRAFT_84780 [Lentinula aff. lateritia]|uniref:Uncharacterized protein n=1 Tax=Lentinula aff. lateritia TaxID=2804960 RepID=A0ACC1TGF2_9AGAR|nr:hypothetical protein F5876DRAFT_84780 [Lentinula aff. lateritia]